LAIIPRNLAIKMAIVPRNSVIANKDSILINFNQFVVVSLEFIKEEILKMVAKFIMGCIFNKGSIQVILFSLPIVILEENFIIQNLDIVHIKLEFTLIEFKLVFSKGFVKDLIIAETNQLEIIKEGIIDFIIKVVVAKDNLNNKVINTDFANFSMGFINKDFINFNKEFVDFTKDFIINLIYL
jgi:hypothetical protein